MPLRSGIYNQSLAFQIMALLMNETNLPIKGREILRHFSEKEYSSEDCERTLLEMHSLGYFQKTNPDSIQRARVYKIIGITEKGTSFFFSNITEKQKSRFLKMTFRERIALLDNITSCTATALSIFISGCF